MRLLNLDDGEVVATPETLALKPFRDIWDRDKSKSKRKAWLELALVYHNCDTRSTFINEYPDEDERIKNICEDLGFGEDYKVDEILRNAFEYYKSKRSSAEIMLDGLRSFALNTNEYLKTARIGETDETIAQLTQSADKLIGMADKINKLEVSISKTLEEEDNVRGGKENFSMYEKGVEV